MFLTESINFLSIIFFLDEQPDESKLLKWVKVSKKKIDMIKDKVKFKMQKIIIGKLDQIVKSLLLLSNLINYFKI